MELIEYTPLHSESVVLKKQSIFYSKPQFTPIWINSKESPKIS